jgi:hypothetical protein
MTNDSDYFRQQDSTQGGTSDTKNTLRDQLDQAANHIESDFAPRKPERIVIRARIIND